MQFFFGYLSYQFFEENTFCDVSEKGVHFIKWYTMKLTIDLCLMRVLSISQTEKGELAKGRFLYQMNLEGQIAV